MTRCPSPAERARAVTEGAPAAWADHLATCPRCRAELAGADEVIALARELAPSPPSAARREEVRTALLLRAEAPASSAARRWWRPAVAAALAAAAAAAIAVARRPTVDAHLPHGLVRPAPGARLTLAGQAGDELVLLEHGAIRVDVVALHPGDRFRVQTRDAELEVRGTTFTVIAEDGELRDVAVAHGRVEVRVEGRPAAVLAAGQSWRATTTIAGGPAADPTPPRVASLPGAPPPAPPAAASSAAPPRDRRAPSPARVTPPAPPVADDAPVAPSAPVAPLEPPVPRDPAALAYDAAWDALRAGRFDRAAAGFAQVELLDGAGALSEDAAYWYAVALARAERPQAIGAFRSFLGAYPASVHVGPAAVALGWLLHDAGEDAEARRRFAAASADPSPEVRAAAARGLAATAAPR